MADSPTNTEAPTPTATPRPEPTAVPPATPKVEMPKPVETVLPPLQPPVATPGPTPQPAPHLIVENPIGAAPAQTPPAAQAEVTPQKRSLLSKLTFGLLGK